MTDNLVKYKKYCLITKIKCYNCTNSQSQDKVRIRELQRKKTKNEKREEK